MNSRDSNPTAAAQTAPATAARALGWTDVPLMCVAELETDGMLERCVRVLLHVSVVDGRRLTPVYLGDAACLRPDLACTMAAAGRS